MFHRLIVLHIFYIDFVSCTGKDLQIQKKYKDFKPLFTGLKLSVLHKLNSFWGTYLNSNYTHISKHLQNQKYFR